MALSYFFNHQVFVCLLFVVCCLLFVFVFYAMALAYFFNHQVLFVGGSKRVFLATRSSCFFDPKFPPQTIPGLRVWTSWLKRTIQTSAHINAPQVQALENMKNKILASKEVSLSWFDCRSVGEL